MYKLFKFNDKAVSIMRLLDGVSIPIDEQNLDYAAYLAWLEAGNQPEAADEIKGE